MRPEGYMEQGVGSTDSAGSDSLYRFAESGYSGLEFTNVLPRRNLPPAGPRSKPAVKVTPLQSSHRQHGYSCMSGALHCKSKCENPDAHTRWNSKQLTAKASAIRYVLHKPCTEIDA